MSSHAPTPQRFAREPLRARVATIAITFLTASLLLFAMGCGSSSKSPFPITGSFSNASLNGHYAFVVSGTMAVGNPLVQSNYREGGVFTADGNGHITAGTDDFNNGTVANPASITGSYTIAKDGNGVIQLNIAGGTETFAITMVSASKFYMTEADAFLNFSANAAGQGELQDSNALSTTPTGTFAFQVHQTLPNPPDSAIVGVLSVSGGAASGEADLEKAAVLTSSPVSATGTFAAPDSSGRGTFIATIGGVVNNYVYYVVNASTLLFLEADNNVLGLGRAEAQTGAPFAATPLAGSFAFGSTGDTATNLSGVNSAGQFAVTGLALSGTYDSVQDGSTTLSQGFNGTINSFDPATGRMSVTITPTGPVNAIQEIWYLVSTTRAFSLVYYPNLPNTTEDGTIEQQSSTSFSTSSLSGQYAFLMDGFTSSGLLTRVGTFIPDGNGNVNVNETTNLYSVIGGVPTSVVTSPIYIKGGTYTVSSSGRGVANLSSLSSNLVFYIVSAPQGGTAKAYLLQGDSGVQMFGPTELQH